MVTILCITILNLIKANLLLLFSPSFPLFSPLFFPLYTILTMQGRKSYYREAGVVQPSCAKDKIVSCLAVLSLPGKRLGQSSRNQEEVLSLLSQTIQCCPWACASLNDRTSWSSLYSDLSFARSFEYQLLDNYRVPFKVCSGLTLRIVGSPQ